MNVLDGEAYRVGEIFIEKNEKGLWVVLICRVFIYFMGCLNQRATKRLSKQS